MVVWVHSDEAPPSAPPPHLCILREPYVGNGCVGHMHTAHVKYSRVMVKFMHHILFLV